MSVMGVIVPFVLSVLIKNEYEFIELAEPEGVDLAVEPGQHFQDQVVRFGCHSVKLCAGDVPPKGDNEGFASPRHSATSLGGCVDRHTAAGQ